MVKTVKEMLEEARREVEAVDHETARRLIAQGALLLDVRDAPEVEASGLPAGARHIPRGMLEFRADPESPLHDPELRRDRPVLLLCASGGRAALAGRTLREMGFARVGNLGGFKEWVEAGGAVEPVARG